MNFETKCGVCAWPVPNWYCCSGEPAMGTSYCAPVAVHPPACGTATINIAHTQEPVW